LSETVSLRRSAVCFDWQDLHNALLVKIPTIGKRLEENNDISAWPPRTLKTVALPSSVAAWSSVTFVLRGSGCDIRWCMVGGAKP
jgi:hypothetical protein